jgi:hypothetical protein
MAIDIIWSTEEGGTSITPPFELGDGGYNGNNPDPVSLWVRHTGEQAITNLRLYLAPFSDDYSGIADPQSDYDELVYDNEGGAWSVIQINLNADDDFPEEDWQAFSELSGGDLNGAIGLGNLEADESINFKLRIVFDEQIAEITPLGVRQIDLRLTYTYTI